MRCPSAGRLGRPAGCGRCGKCIETRLAFHALGIPDDDVFQSHPPLDAGIDGFVVESRLKDLRGQLVRTSELVDAMPDGPIRARLADFENRVRRRYIQLAN